MNSRVVGKLTDYQLAELGPVRGLSIDSLAAEARRRFPFCDLRVDRLDYLNTWEVVATGYIDSEVVEKRDRLPCPQA